MKKHFLILAAIILTAVATFTIVSCNKEKGEVYAVKNVNLTEDSHETNMDGYLLSFKQRLLSAQKGEESYDLEQARIDLCNLLNYDFGDVNLPTNIFEYDTLYVKLVLTDGMVDLSQLAITYNKAFNLILAAYRGLDLPEKSIYSVSCEFEDEGYKDSNAVDLRIVVSYRGFTRSLPSLHDTLSWQPTIIGTSCDDPTMPYGGAVVMRNWIIQAQPALGCPDGGRMYFTNEQDWSKYGYDTFDSTEGRYRIFTLFTYQIDTVCISHEDMEYYFTNILDYFNQEIPSDHVMNCAHVYVDPSYIYYSPYNINHYPGNCWFWYVHIKHGKMNCTDSNAAE